MIPVGDVELILASGSRYRAELLARVAPGFRQVSAQVDETPRPDEPALELVARLARAKAEAVAAAHPGSVVIGSDQVAELDGAIVGKPGTPAAASAQLAAASGRTVAFHTGLCVIDARHVPARHHATIDTTHVTFRSLDAAQIARYLQREPALDCAGSFKAEGLGIALFERIATDDPTALIGLPLIALCRLLAAIGVAVI